MLTGISITCFASSYAVAFCLELTRLLFRSGIRGAIMFGFAGAGLFAHSVFLYHRAATISGPPLSSERDWYLLAAWGLAATYLYLAYYHRHAAFGLFILPLVLGLLGLAAFAADPQPFAQAPASQIWGIIHGVSILMATLAVLVGFAAGLMYLGQAYRLKRKWPLQRGLQLPNLEWLERTNSRAIVISLGMLTVGVLSGIILNLIRAAGRVPWYDPVVLSTVIMSAWLVATAGAGLCYQPARRGRKVAYLTIVSFLFLAIVLGAQLFLRTQHGGPRSARHSHGTSGPPTAVVGDSA
jgi:ABC-type uncharacterized transport system permease subunit